MKMKTTRIIDDGEIVYESEQTMNFSRFTDKGYVYVTNNRKLMILLNPGLPDMRAADQQHLISLCECLTVDNMIAYNGRYAMNVQEMAKHLHVTAKVVYPMLSRLDELNVVRKVDRAYYVNPVYITQNRHITPACYEVFADILVDHLPSWAISRYERIITVPKTD